MNIISNLKDSVKNVRDLNKISKTITKGDCINSVIHAAVSTLFVSFILGGGMMVYSFYSIIGTVISLLMDTWYQSGTKDEFYDRQVRCYKHLNKSVTLETSIDIIIAIVAIATALIYGLKLAAIAYIAISIVADIVSSYQGKGKAYMYAKIYPNVLEKQRVDTVTSTITTTCSLLGSFLGVGVSAIADMFNSTFPTLVAVFTIVIMEIAELSNNSTLLKAWKLSLDLPDPERETEEGDNEEEEAA